MIRMRMVEADDVHPLLARLALSGDQLLRRYVVTVMRRILARISASHNLFDHAGTIVHFSQQHPAALMRIGLLTMFAYCFVIRVGNSQHLALVILSKAKDPYRHYSGGILLIQP